MQKPNTAFQRSGWIGPILEIGIRKTAILIYRRDTFQPPAERYRWTASNPVLFSEPCPWRLPSTPTEAGIIALQFTSIAIIAVLYAGTNHA